MPLRSFHLSAGAAVLAACLAACSDNSGPSSTSGAMTAAEADSLAQVLTDDADEVVAASDFSPASVTGLGVHHLRIEPHFHGGPPPCDPTFSPDPPTNSDSDIIPDSVRFDFAGCSFSRGPFDFTAAGTIDVIDPSPTVTEFAVRLVFNDFSKTWTNTQNNRTWSTVHNGTRQVSANADALDHLITNFVTDFTFPDGATASHVRTWTVHFDADVPGSIAFGSPLPEGDWTFAGSSTWSKGSRSWSLQTATTTALHFDPSCTVAPRFTAGQLQATVTRNGDIVNVTIDFTACGQYTVTRSVPSV